MRVCAYLLGHVEGWTGQFPALPSSSLLCHSLMVIEKTLTPEKEIWKLLCVLCVNEMGPKAEVPIKGKKHQSRGGRSIKIFYLKVHYATFLHKQTNKQSS